MNNDDEKQAEINLIELEFWKQIYIASIQSSHSNPLALQTADAALQDLRKRWS